MRSWREKEEFSGRRGGDCEWNRNPFDTPLQKPSFADVQTSYLHLYPPSGLDGGVRMSWNSGDGRGGGVCVYLYRGESSGERWIYPDTEIFASMLSTITHRTSSTEGRAIFQATVGGYVYRVTCMRPYTDREGCTYTGKRKPILVHVYDAIARVCANATLMARIFVEFVTYLFHPSPLYTCTHRQYNQIVSRVRVGGGAMLDLDPRKWRDDAYSAKIVSLE